MDGHDGLVAMEHLYIYIYIYIKLTRSRDCFFTAIP